MPAPPRRTLRLPQHPLDRLRLTIVILAVIFVAGLSAWQATYLTRARNDAVDVAKARGATLTAMLAGHLERVLAEADATLTQLSVIAPRLGGPTGPPADWLMTLTSTRQAVPGISSLTVLDEQGIVRHSTVAQAVGQSRRDYLVFKRLSSDPAAPDVVSDVPFRGLVTGRVGLPIGRKLKHPDGSFAGAVVAVIDPEALRRFYASIDVGPGGSLWVVHGTGTVVIRQPSPPPRMGMALPDDAPLRGRLSARSPAHYVGDVDRASQNLTSLQSVEGGSLAVALTASQDDILRDWRREAMASITALALIVLVTIVAIIVVDRELVARRTAEDELRRRNAVLNRAQEIAGIWSVRLSHDGTLSQLSAGAQAMLGGGTSRLADLLRLIPDSTEAGALVDAIARCREEGSVARLELALSAGAGSTRSLVADVARDSAQEQSVVLVCQDVTERRAMESALRHSQKMESIGHLASGIAHDFNNLLMVVVGNAEEALDDIPHDNPARPAVQTIQEAAERGAELTKQLLAFSRSQVLSPVRVDVHALIEGMRSMLQRTLGSTIDVVIRDRDGPSLAFVDPGQIEHALMNLAINARDAMPDGGDLTIATTEVGLDDGDVAHRPDLRPGRYVRLSVSDTGTGMSAETVRRAADPFFTTKEIGQGVGLGLSIVHGVAQQSGGHVTIDSEPGRGTTVSVFLPVPA